MTLDFLRELLAGEPEYRIQQAARAVFSEGTASLEDVTAFPAVLRGRLRGVPILCIHAEALHKSRDALAHKAVVRLSDGKRVETVLMSPKPGLWTSCVSSQVGCALRCGFCATGLMGFSRNLSAEEITDQVLFWRRYVVRHRLGRLSNVVYMGMGEPFLNVENVFTSLRWLSDPRMFGMGPRHLSVSTVGIAQVIGRFARAFPQVNLALSLHSAVPEIRRRLVPADQAYPLHSLISCLQDYFQVCRRKVFLEYVLLDRENDRPQDARALARFIEDIGYKKLLHVNLIVYNPTQTPHRPGSRASARLFASVLRESGVHVTFRKNLGQDIEAACGQLVVKGDG